MAAVCFVSSAVATTADTGTLASRSRRKTTEMAPWMQWAEFDLSCLSKCSPLAQVFAEFAEAAGTSLGLGFSRRARRLQPTAR